MAFGHLCTKIHYNQNAADKGVMPMNKKRLWLASTVAPVTPIVVVILVPALLTQGQAYGNALPMAILFGLLTSYLGTIALGVPQFLMLQRFGRLNLTALSLAGAASGVLVFSCFLYLFGLLLDSQVSIGATEILWGAGLGVMVAVPFSLLSGITNAGKGRS